MNQIYNLAQTIAADKETIAKLEKHLLNAKSILAAHENAMQRLTTIPKVIVSYNKETPATVDFTACGGGASGERERITQENYLRLGIEVGDKVDIVASGDKDFESGTIAVVIGLDRTNTETFLELDQSDNGCSDWYWYGHEKHSDDELYLIRTPEGSLNK